MERIYQDYSGDVESLINLVIIEAVALVDEINDDVILIWLKEKNSNLWLRIFIDGVYCGIDRYKNNEIELDDDDGIERVNLTECFNNREIKSAVVSSENSKITLALSFIDAVFKLICTSEKGECHYNFEYKANT